MAIYYIDSSRSDDSGNGLTAETAKKTIAAGLALITADDCTLRFVGGSTWYNEVLNTVLYNGITYASYGAGNTPILRHGYLLTSSSWTGPDGNGCYIYPGTGINCYWIIEEGHALKKGSDATLPEGAGTWWCAGTWEADIYYKPTGGGDPTSNGLVVERCAGVGSNLTATSANITDTIIDGLRFDFAGFNIWSADYCIAPLTIQNCVINEAWATAIYINNSGQAYADVVIFNNSFNYCRDQLYLVAEGSGYFIGAIIRDNTLIGSNYLYNSTVPWRLTGDIDGLSIQTIRNSIIEGNNISGYCVNADGDSGAISCWVPGSFDCTGNIIRRNYIHDVQGSGIIWAGSDVPDTDCQIYDNIVTDFGVYGFHLVKGQTSDTKSGIYNNTITNGSSGIRLQAQADYYLIKNNIIDNCTYAINLESGYGANNVANHNLYHHPTSLKFKVGGVEKTLAEYQAIVTPDDSDALSDDPLFVNAGGSYLLDTDFKLQSGSPCINAGVDVGLTTDYGGFSIVGNPDIGAWEYGGSLYTRYHYNTLPTDDADLTTIYTESDITKVATDDTDMVPQSATDEYAIHQFKVDASGKTSVTIDWVGQSNVPCTQSAVYLQIYDQVEIGWTTIDSDTTTLANTDIPLEFFISDLGPYKDVNGIITCRVYQEAK